MNDHTTAKHFRTSECANSRYYVIHNEKREKSSECFLHSLFVVFLYFSFLLFLSVSLPCSLANKADINVVVLTVLGSEKVTKT